MYFNNIICWDDLEITCQFPTFKLYPTTGLQDLGCNYYATPSKPEGLRHCPGRGNTGGALVYLGEFCTVHSVHTVNYVTKVTTVNKIALYFQALFQFHKI